MNITSKKENVLLDRIEVQGTLEFEDLDIDTRFKMETSGWMISPYTEEDNEEPAREKILESRLILSQNIKSWNISKLNLTGRISAELPICTE